MGSKMLLSIGVGAAISFTIYAGANHHGSSHHSMDHGENIPLIEGGQAGFAAIIEIVNKLEQSDETDWSRVDISNLREHLLDMDTLFSETSATQTQTGNRQIQFAVFGDRKSIASIHRMVPTHAKFIEQSRGWAIETTLHADGATVSITVDDNSDFARLHGLGFYGFMSLDSHHQQHHFQMARGMSH